MSGWLWMIAGAAVAVLALIAGVACVKNVEDRRSASMRAVSAHQVSAEQQMQRVVQNTINDMFRAVRDYW